MSLQSQIHNLVARGFHDDAIAAKLGYHDAYVRAARQRLGLPVNARAGPLSLEQIDHKLALARKRVRTLERMRRERAAPRRVQ